MATNIYIVDDNELVQETLREFINAIPGFYVCGGAMTASAALAQIPQLAVDLVIVDVALPDLDGIQLVAQLRAQQPSLRCLMFSGHQQRSYVEQALAVGAVGFVAKGNPPELITAINTVLTGEVYLSSTLYVAQPMRLNNKP